MMMLVLMLLPLSAFAMTEQRAQTLVKAADSRAKKAKQFWVYPEGDGAWVFYSTGHRTDQALFKGAFWYVTEENQYTLGEYTQNVFSWEHYDSNPPVFYCDTIYGSNREHHPHVAILKDGAPLEIEDLGELTGLGGNHGSLMGHGAHDRFTEPERVFLGVKGDKLVEIAAMPITEAEALKIYGMDEILNELAVGNALQPGGVIPVAFLFRNASPGCYLNTYGIVQGSVTINLDNHGTPGHLYVFIDENGIACPNRGWENELAIIEGTANDHYNIGLEIVDTVKE